MELSPECVRPRCGRAEWEHDLHDCGGADDVRVRIWRALGTPCRQFIDASAVLAPDQAATSRWAAMRGQRAPQPAPVRTSDTYSRGAALARQALAQRREAS